MSERERMCVRERERKRRREGEITFTVVVLSIRDSLNKGFFFISIVRLIFGSDLLLKVLANHISFHHRIINKLRNIIHYL